MQPFSPGLLVFQYIDWKKKITNFNCLLSYLSVTHTGCSNEGLLDGLALLKHPLLLAGHCPVTLNQKLDDLQMTSECSMDQSTLSILIQVIHLREGDREICVNEEWGCTPTLVISSHCTAWTTESVFPTTWTNLRKFRGYSPTQPKSLLSHNSGRSPLRLQGQAFVFTSKETKKNPSSSSFVFLRYILLCP